MIPDETPNAGSASPEPPAGIPARRRGRRGGRGRRGRGGRRPLAASAEAPAAAQEDAATGDPVAEALPEAPASAEAPAAAPEALEAAGRDVGAPAEPPAPPKREQRQHRPLPVQHRPAPAQPREFHPATPAAVTSAIEQVNHIIETLQATLKDMEEVLETVEYAERQKTADEQEIETLRRSLHQLHRPREGGQPHPRR